MNRNFKNVEPKNRSAWREWLSKNHTQKENIWLVIYKKGHDGSTLTVSEAVEEALCFGWIDSTANKLDEKRFKIMYSPRKPKSVWSKINKGRVAKLIKGGFMQPAGMAMIKLAKKTGTWNTLNDVDALKYPEDFNQALVKSRKSKSNFDAFPPSAKKLILFWIQSAKTSETRTKRIKETVSRAARNERANQYIKKA
jgi:uncharacterized protein YdeI (YjbR/CyaY-like superfamily)